MIKSKRMYGAEQNIKAESASIHQISDFFELGKSLSELPPDDLEALICGIYHKQEYISDPENVGDPFMIKNHYYKW